MSASPTANFDRLSRIFCPLEFLAFGRDLERARFYFLATIRDCREILVLGEGDGRALARLVEIAPQARFHCVDSSAAMLARAEARLSNHPARHRVTFTHADIFAAHFLPAHYDAVTTFFFLDCFSAEQVAAIIARVKPGLRSEAQWLFADFVLPPRGLLQLRARAWLAVLYAFFRWQTGLAVRELPPSEQLLREAGFACRQTREFQAGLVRSAVFIRS